MAKELIDLSKLGERTVTRIEIAKVETAPGVYRFDRKRIEEAEIQPILNEEEVTALGDAVEWVPTKKALKRIAKYTCIAQGRRFFCDVTPPNIQKKLDEERKAAEKAAAEEAKKLAAEEKKAEAERKKAAAKKEAEKNVSDK